MKRVSLNLKTTGHREYNDCKIVGRVNLDMFVHVTREHKLSSYSLNSVSLAFLGDQKEDLHYSTIHGLQAGTDETRRRIAIYCIKDCVLPLELMDRMMCIINYTEMARVTGVSFNALLTRG
jgi:DNA polymerase delta subunit 1